MLSGWDSAVMLRGLSSVVLMGVVLFAFAFFSLRARTRRK